MLIRWLILAPLFLLCLSERTNTTVSEKHKNNINYIIKKLGGWPVVEGNRWNKSEFSWIQTQYRLKKMKLPYKMFLDVDIGVHPSDSAKRIFWVRSGLLNEDSESFKDGRKSRAATNYLNRFVQLAELYGARKEKAVEEMDRTISLEVELAEITPFNRDKYDYLDTYRIMKLKEIAKEYTFIPWLPYVKIMFNLNLPNLEKRDVVVANPDYLDEIEEVLKKHSRRTLANYMIASTVSRIYYALHVVPKKLND